MLSGIDSHLPNAWTFTRSKATFSVRDLEPKGKRLGEGEPVYHDPTGIRWRWTLYPFESGSGGYPSMTMAWNMALSLY